jgi:hypothetical protein
MTDEAIDGSIQTASPALLAETAAEPAIGAPTPGVEPAIGVPMNPRTGEPQRGWTVRLSALAHLLAVIASAGSLLWTYWTAVDDFAGAAWLLSRFSDPEVGTEVLLVVAVTVAALVVGVLNSITAYYTWIGYRWTQTSGIISAVAGLLMLLLNPIGWTAIPLAIIGAALLRAQSSSAFFFAWEHHRHPEAVLTERFQAVSYGPLPRYRRT